MISSTKEVNEIKRLKNLLICLSLLFLLVACSDGNDPPNSDLLTSTDNSVAIETDKQDTTLMIYMVGSDLEAKGGAGTNDMEEIRNSSVDLSENNVVIYAGGSKVWHNDNLTAESGHSIMRLSDDGFSVLETQAEASMGEASTLEYFLNYCYTNFKTTKYALILWDHGNGPLIGYGKDMLHDNDALTLLEMQAALEASPFSESNKLSWVGFDACLMSSIELACILHDYADYLIASQEIEPTFGWNYSFLKDLGKASADTLANSILQEYMDSCLAYYERKNYDHRDTTLSCMDLSKLDDVRDSLEALFAKANTDVGSSYSVLASARVNSRALGRATTGSEYDLIDLVSMLEQLKPYYPEQCESVIRSLDGFIIHNVTNAADCCGISIYYPFYNKKHYEKAWGDTYSDLNALPCYVEYLGNYAQSWLKNDLMQTTASSTVPQVKSEHEYLLKLTDEQSANFASARYYILNREGEQIYTRIYSSSDVTKSQNILTANFDGDILYAKNNFDEYWIPVVAEHDTVGDYTRYSAYVNLTNELPLIFGIEEPEGYEHTVLGHRFYISVNNKTKQIYKSALVPYNENVDTETLLGGKTDDADLSQWSRYYFIHERHRYLQRDENGVILPISKWEKSDYLSANVSRVDDGLEFVMAPIPAGEYYLIFEIEDVQGNKYCSELLPIESKGGTLPRSFVEQPVSTSWTSGDSVELFSQAGVTVYLTSTEQYDEGMYALTVKNDNPFDVAVLGHELMYNGSVDCSDGSFGYFVIKAGDTTTGGNFDFGTANDLGQTEGLRSIQFSLSVITASNDQTLIYMKEVSVELSEQTAALMHPAPEDSWFNDRKVYINTLPCRSLYANEQVLFDREGLKCVLLGLGGNGEDGARLVLTLRLENTSSVSQTVNIYGLLFDGIFLNKSTGPLTIYPGTLIYRAYIITEDELNMHGIVSASSLKITVAHMEFATLQGGGGFSKTEDYIITLAKNGKAAVPVKGQDVLYRDQSLQISLSSQEELDIGGYIWVFTLNNNGDSDIMLDSADLFLNGKLQPADSLFVSVLAPYSTRCPAGMSTVFRVKYTDDVTGDINIKFTPKIYDFAGEKLLYSCTEISINN